MQQTGRAGGQSPLILILRRLLTIGHLNQSGIPFLGPGFQTLGGLPRSVASQKVGNGKVLVQFRPMNPGSITDPEPISSFLFRSPKESWKPNQGYRKSTAIFQLQFEAVLQNRQKKRRVEQRCPLSRNSFPFSKIKDWLSHNRDSIRKRVPGPNGEGDRFF